MLHRSAIAFLLITAAVTLHAGAKQTAERLAFEIQPPRAGEDKIDLPLPSGPRAVGTSTWHWVLDEEESMTDAPGDRRELIATLFYPTEATGGLTSAYVPELPLLRRGLLVHGFPPFAEDSHRIGSYAGVVTSAIPDSALPSSGAPFSLVLISPGGNMSRHWYTALAQELASHGYVVAVMSHAHSGMDVFPGGGFLASHLFWHPGDDVPADEVARRDSLLAERLAFDALQTIDGLEELDAELQGAIDFDRVALIGHSRGGSTVTAACARDTRIDACIIFDNVGEVAGFDSRLSQPRLTLRAPWSESRSTRLAGILEHSTSDAFDVVVDGANHFSFTDLPIIDPAGYPSDDIDPREAHGITARLTVAFLETYLESAESAFRDALAADGVHISVRAF